MTGDFERAGLFRYERSDLFSIDPAEAEKRQRATELRRRDGGALSIQVLLINSELGSGDKAKQSVLLLRQCDHRRGARARLPRTLY
jgi:hypothetical protein